MIKLIFFLIVIGFSVIQSIVKAANEKAAAKERQAQLGAAGGKKKVQNEIESFLQDVTGKTAPARNEGMNDIQEQRDQERRDNRRQEAVVRKREQQAKTQQARAQQKNKRPPAAAPAAKSRSRKPSERRIGSGVNEHVNSYIGKHVDQYMDHDVNEYVEKTITRGVQSHLGTGVGTRRPTTTGRQKNQAAAGVAALLRDPQGVRNAVLINEILSRPRSMQK